MFNIINHIKWLVTSFIGSVFFVAFVLEYEINRIKNNNNNFTSIFNIRNITLNPYMKPLTFCSLFKKTIGLQNPQTTGADSVSLQVFFLTSFAMHKAGVRPDYSQMQQAPV